MTVRLSEDKIKRILKAIAEGVKGRALEERFGLSRGTAWKLKQRMNKKTDDKVN